MIFKKKLPFQKQKTMKIKKILFGITTCTIVFCSCKKNEAIIEPVTPVLPVTPVPVLATVKTWLVDKNATDETASLFYNLKQIAKSNILFGHQDDTKRGVTNAVTQWANEQQFTGVSTVQSDVKTITGAYPAVYGHDFIHMTNFATGNWFDYEKSIARTLTIEAYNRGGINTYCWHYANPVSKGGFYWSDSPVIAVNQVLPGGTANETFKASLKIVADYAQTLIGADGKLIPIIFRPFHEMDGNWFWWGNGHCTAGEYIAMYRYMVKYLRDDLGIRNFLYAWSPDRNFNSQSQYLNYYPGDDYVDLVGTDNYEDMKANVSPEVAASKFKIVSDYAKAHNKLAALTETGLQNLSKVDWFTGQLLKSLKNQNIEFAYALLWANTKDAYWTPYAGHPAASDFMSFKNDGYVLFADKMPSVYQIK
jgi:mannan endo-1,4-beta-mannosidase